MAVALFALVLALYALPSLAPSLELWNLHWAQVSVVGGLPLALARALDAGERLLLVAAALPYLACLAWAFVHLDRLLRGFERGEFFAGATIKHLRAFAGLLLLARILAMVAGHLRVAIVASFHDTPRHIVLNVTSDEMALVMLCTLIFLIAHMLEEGGRLEDENRSFF